jgi:hypothetical protein
MGKLINYQYLKTETDISQNIDDEELDNPIKRAMESLMMVLGEDLYNELLDQYPGALSVSNSTLYNNHIKKYLAWQAYEYWITKANYKFTRSGIRIHTEENSTLPTDAQIAALYKDAKEQASKYRSFMLNYINRNINNYPLYQNNCNVNSNYGFQITPIGKNIHDCNCKCHACHHSS